MLDTPASASAALRPRRAGDLLVGGAAVGVGAAAALTGQLDALAGAALSMGQLPLLVLAVLAWLAPRSPAARWLAIAALCAGGLLLAGLTLSLATLALDTPRASAAPLAGLALLLGGLLATPALLLVRGVRGALARLLPLDPAVDRHWIGLVALTWFTLMPLASLLPLGGQPVLQGLHAHLDGSRLGLPSDAELLYSLAWTVALCLVAVGYPGWATLPAALARLGLTWPGWRALGGGVALSVVMVPLFLGVDRLATAAVVAAGLEPTATSWLDQLFGRSYGIGGALAAALTAGLGEELVWRGVVQPRYGLLPAALGFAAMHAFQYGPDGLISVLLAGLLLGVVRTRSNTTVAAVVHGGYDLWLLLGVLAGWW